MLKPPKASISKRQDKSLIPKRSDLTPRHRRRCGLQSTPRDGCWGPQSVKSSVRLFPHFLPQSLTSSRRKDCAHTHRVLSEPQPLSFLFLKSIRPALTLDPGHLLYTCSPGLEHHANIFAWLAPSGQSGLSLKIYFIWGQGKC